MRRIQSLKIGYNNVFGYYLEVRNTYKDLVPETWIRKQTLAQAERYITQELKEYEETILGAEEKILSLEMKLFNDLVLAMQEFIPQIQINASLVAQLFCRSPYVTIMVMAAVSMKARPEYMNVMPMARGPAVPTWAAGRVLSAPPENRHMPISRHALMPK